MSSRSIHVLQMARYYSCIGRWILHHCTTTEARWEVSLMGKFSKSEPCGRRKLRAQRKERQYLSLLWRIWGRGLIVEIQVGIHQIDLMRGWQNCEAVYK